MPSDSIPARGGTYVLLMQLQQQRNIVVGGLGSHDMPGGYYCYVGSAFGPGGLRARLHHHARLAKSPHWHIDYLRHHAPLVEIWYTQTQLKREHDYASLLRAMSMARVPVAGFGASDCKCSSHLVHLPARPGFEDFRQALSDAGYADGIERLIVS